MDELLVFVTARIDEEEARGRNPGHYHCDDCWYSCPKAVESCGSARTGSDDCDCDAEKRGAEILARVAALRALVGLHGAFLDCWGKGVVLSDDTKVPVCATCHNEDYVAGITDGEYPCPTLRHVAAVWAWHPDFREAWTVATA